jgi:hypothetical protein
MIRNIVFVFKPTSEHSDVCASACGQFLRAFSDINFQFIPVKTVNNLYFFFFLRYESINKSSW